MIQGGSLNGDGTGGVGLPITGEFVSNGIINPIGHYRGVLSMARTNDPNSADVQFFICHAVTMLHLGFLQVVMMCWMK